MKQDKRRMMRYLERQYSNLSQEAKKLKLKEITDRLRNVNFLDDETLQEVVQALQDEEGWSLAKVLAHLDMIDYDDRS